VNIERPDMFRSQTRDVWTSLKAISRYLDEAVVDIIKKKTWTWRLCIFHVTS